MTPGGQFSSYLAAMFGSAADGRNYFLSFDTAAETNSKSTFKTFKLFN